MSMAKFRRSQRTLLSAMRRPENDFSHVRLELGASMSLLTSLHILATRPHLCPAPGPPSI